MSWPALRTVRDGDRRVSGWDWLAVLLGTWLGPPALGLGVAALLDAWSGAGEAPAALAWAAVPLTFVAMQALAPYVTWALVPVGMLAGAGALRRGWAGWAVAAGLPAVLAVAVVAAYAPTSGYPPRTHLGPAAIFAASAALHGGLAWLLLRWRRPEAVAPRAP